MKNLKLIAVLVLLPLCLVLLGGWQLQRSLSSDAEHERRLAEMTTLRPALIAMQARSSTATLDVGSQRISIPEALKRQARVSTHLETQLSIDRARHGLAIMVMVTSLLAALIGLIGLLGVSRAAARAAHSRERLLQTFTWVSQRLPYVLMGHVLAMSAAVVGIMGFEGLSLWPDGQLSQVRFSVMIVVGAFGLLCVYMLWRAIRQLRVILHMFEPAPLPVLGQAVGREQAPGLWTFVDALAERLGALAPQHIVVGLSEGFYVTSSDVQLQPCGTSLSGRTLHVPITYLGVLDSAEVSAVIGHELAHFAGEDTEYSLRFLPIYDGIGRSMTVMVDILVEGGLLQRLIMQPSFMLGLHFLASFDHSVSHWSRQRELAADAAGAQLGGQLAAASALVRISAIEPLLVQGLEARMVPAMAADPEQPREVDLPASLFNELAQQALVLPDDYLTVQLPHPSDTHPCNGERLVALQVETEVAISRGVRPVDAVQAGHVLHGYFSDAPGLCARLGQDFLDYYAVQDAELVQQLRDTAGRVEGEVHLHEGARIHGWVTTVLFGLMTGAGLVALLAPLFLPQETSDAKEVLLIVGFIATGVGASLLPSSVRLIRRADQTALSLTPDHLVFANIKTPVPIWDIALFNLEIHQGTQLSFILEEQVPLPEITRRGYFQPGAKVDRKQRLVTLKLEKFCRDGKTLQIDELAELVQTYINAGHARHVLQQL